MLLLRDSRCLLIVFAPRGRAGAEISAPPACQALKEIEREIKISNVKLKKLKK